MNVLLDLQRLIRGMSDDQIRRKDLAELREFLVDGLTERGDLLLVAHVDRERDRTAALPFSLWVPPSVIVQVLCGALVSPADFDKITQIDWCADRRGGHRHIAYRVNAFKLTGRIENYLSLASLERATGSGDVASGKHASERRRLQ